MRKVLTYSTIILPVVFVVLTFWLTAAHAEKCLTEEQAIVYCIAQAMQSGDNNIDACMAQFGYTK